MFFMKRLITSFCIIALISYASFGQFTIADGVLTAYTGTDEDVVIPDNVIVIAANVFKGKGTIKSVTGNYVTKLGNEAFNNCNNLATVNFPNVEEIGNQVFRNNAALTETNFGSVKTIGNDAFLNCSKLESFDFSKVVSIGTDAFAACIKLGPTVTLSANLNKFGGNSFARCNSLQNIEIALDNATWKSVGGILFTKDDPVPAIVAYPCGRTGKYKIPDDVLVVDFGAFAGSQLDTLDLNYVDEVGTYAFYMSKIKSMKADNVVKTGLVSFRDVKELDSIALPALKTLGERTFQGNNGNKLEVIDLRQATKLNSIGTDPFRDVTSKGITVYVASEAIKTLLQEKVTQSNINIVVESMTTNMTDNVNMSKLYIQTYDRTFSIVVNALVEGKTISVFDLVGKQVLTQYILENNMVNLQSLKKGVYILRIGEISEKISI